MQLSLSKTLQSSGFNFFLSLAISVPFSTEWDNEVLDEPVSPCPCYYYSCSRNSDYQCSDSSGRNYQRPQKCEQDTAHHMCRILFWLAVDAMRIVKTARETKRGLPARLWSRCLNDVSVKIADLCGCELFQPMWDVEFGKNGFHFWKYIGCARRVNLRVAVELVPRGCLGS